MTSKIIAGFAALVLALSAAPLANAAKMAAHKTMHQQAAHHAKHHHYAHAKGCKGEFMYMKGGKCMDARKKA